MLIGGKFIVPVKSTGTLFSIFHLITWWWVLLLGSSGGIWPCHLLLGCRLPCDLLFVQRLVAKECQREDMKLAPSHWLLWDSMLTEPIYLYSCIIFACLLLDGYYLWLSGVSVDCTIFSHLLLDGYCLQPYGVSVDYCEEVPVPLRGCGGLTMSTWMWARWQSVVLKSPVSDSVCLVTIDVWQGRHSLSHFFMSIFMAHHM